jgi:hypothetical protein
MEPNFVTIILWWTIYIFLSDRSAPIQYGHHCGTLFNIGPYGKHFANFLFRNRSVNLGHNNPLVDHTNQYIPTIMTRFAPGSL